MPRVIPEPPDGPKIVDVVGLDDACEGCGVTAGQAVIFVPGGPALCFACLGRAWAVARAWKAKTGAA